MTDPKQFTVIWVDGKREPRNPPNPNYPDGIDLNLSGGKPSCEVKLPYPAKRIGKYMIHCLKCQSLNVVTTAGRPDDPRSVKFACLLKVQ